MNADPDRLASVLLTGELDRLTSDEQRLARYIWARAALDWGILLLIGHEHRDDADWLICTLQEDGSCYMVERPAKWDYEQEARYIATFKALLASSGS